MVGGKVLAVIGCRVGSRQQKQGSPGYCCSVGGYQQPGSPLPSRHRRWAEGAMDGTTFSLSLSPACFNSYSTPPSCACCPRSPIVLFFPLPFRQHNLSLSSDISPCISYSPSTLCAFFSLSPVPYHFPIPHQPTHTLVLKGGF